MLALIPGLRAMEELLIACVMMMMMMMMVNCFCGVVDRRKAFSLISSGDHCQRSPGIWYPFTFSKTPRSFVRSSFNFTKCFSFLAIWTFGIWSKKTFEEKTFTKALLNSRARSSSRLNNERGRRDLRTRP